LGALSVADQHQLQQQLQQLNLQQPPLPQQPASPRLQPSGSPPSAGAAFSDAARNPSPISVADKPPGSSVDRTDPPSAPLGPAAAAAPLAAMSLEQILQLQEQLRAQQELIAGQTKLLAALLGSRQAQQQQGAAAPGGGGPGSGELPAAADGGN
jgi:hypothetical protein